MNDVDAVAHDERDIESQSPRANTVIVGPTECRHAHGPALVGRHRLARRPEVVVAARLHLAHCERSVLLGDDVDLAASVPHVASHDAPPVACVPGCGEVLAPQSTGASRGG